MRCRLAISACALACLLCVTGCATTGAVHEEIRAVAVWDLEDLSPALGARPDLGQVLSGEIIQTLQARRDITVVERDRLIAVMEELRLGSSELADEETRLRVGRMLGAREMVFGGYMVVGSAMRIDLRRVDVETGRVMGAVKKTAGSSDFAGWLDAARQAGSLLFPE